MKRVAISLMAALIFVGGMASFPSRVFASQANTDTAVETEKVCNRWQDDFVVGNTVVFRARTKAGGLCPEERIAIINQRWVDILSEIQKTGEARVSSLQYDPKSGYMAGIVYQEDTAAIMQWYKKKRKNDPYEAFAVIFVNGKMLFTVTEAEWLANGGPMVRSTRIWHPVEKIEDPTLRKALIKFGKKGIWEKRDVIYGMYIWRDVLLRRGLVDMKLLPPDSTTGKPRPPYSS